MKLNLLAAMFLPLIGLSGLFGMNVVNGLEDSRGALWIIAAVGLGGGYALLRVFIGKNHQ
jgi:Mg2+ and Co2+ transporter CorA